MYVSTDCIILPVAVEYCNLGFLTNNSAIANLSISGGSSQWTTINKSDDIIYNKYYGNVGIGTDTLDASYKFTVYGNNLFYGSILANKIYLNDDFFIPKISINNVLLLPYLLPNSIYNYYYAFNTPNIPSSITFQFPTYCSILIVGGGGNGGIGIYAGGGGAGEVIYISNYLMSVGTYNIIVGNKGGGYSTIIDQYGNNVFLALGGGNGGSVDIFPSSGGSGGGGYGGASIQSGATTTSFWNSNNAIGLVTKGNIGTPTIGGVGGSAIAGGFISSITGTSKTYGIGGNGGYIGAIINTKIPNTGCGGDGNTGLGSTGTVIFSFENNLNINNIFVNSNTINNVMINNNIINKEKLNNYLIPYVSSNIISKIVNQTQWSSNKIFNSLYYNIGSVGIGTTLVDSGINFKVTGNTLINGNLSTTNLLLGTTLVLPIITYNNNPLNILNNIFQFTNTSTYYNITFTDNINCDLLVVGGGGDGGTGIYSGGGGGGEVIYLQNYTFNPGNYTIYVGNNNQGSGIYNESGYLFYANYGGKGGTYNTITNLFYNINTGNITIYENTYIYWNNNISLIYVIPGIYSLSFANGRATLANLNNTYTDNLFCILTSDVNVIILPKAWYKFNLDGITNDASGYNNILSAINNPIYDVGIKGNACVSLVSIKQQYLYNGYLNVSEISYSISFWVYIKNNNCCIFSMGTTILGPYTALIVSFDSTNKLIFSYINDNLESPIYSNDINNWSHWVVIYSSLNKSKFIYHNGIKVATQTNSGILKASNGLYIGSKIGASDYFNGFINDFRIYYNTVLTDQQVLNLYNGILNIYKNTSTKGGSGGGGSIYQFGSLNGNNWSSNLGVGLVNYGASGSLSYGGGGGGAVNIGFNNSGGYGLNCLISQTIINYGSGGNGSTSSMFLPSTKIANTGSGGDGNGGLGSSGIVILKFNNSVTNINNIFVSSNQINNLTLNNKFINSNILNNFLIPYVSSNSLANLVTSSQWSNISITSNIFFNYNIGIGTTYVPEKLNILGNINLNGNLIANSLTYKYILPEIKLNNNKQFPISITNTSNFYYIFSDTSTTYSVNFASNVLCDILIVGGGGNGGTGLYGGGGGGGEVIYICNYVVNPDNYYISVGNNTFNSLIYNNNNYYI